MRLLGIDYGEKWIGVAYSQGYLSEALTQFTRKEAIGRLEVVCSKLQIEEIIMGLPEGRIAPQVRLFAAQLAERLHLPVRLWDETLSTHLADTQLVMSGMRRKKRVEKIHQYAAAHLLAAYLEQTKNDPR